MSKTTYNRWTNKETWLFVLNIARNDELYTKLKWLVSEANNDGHTLDFMSGIIYGYFTNVLYYDEFIQIDEIFTRDEFKKVNFREVIESFF